MVLSPDVSVRRVREYDADGGSFFRRYTMIAVCPLLYIFWKLFKKTKIYSAKEIDLQKNLDEIAEYERTYVPIPAK